MIINLHSKTSGWFEVGLYNSNTQINCSKNYWDATDWKNTVKAVQILQALTKIKIEPIITVKNIKYEFIDELRLKKDNDSLFLQIQLKNVIGKPYALYQQLD